MKKRYGCQPACSFQSCILGTVYLLLQLKKKCFAFFKLFCTISAVLSHHSSIPLLCLKRVDWKNRLVNHKNDVVYSLFYINQKTGEIYFIEKKLLKCVIPLYKHHLPT